LRSGIRSKRALGALLLVVVAGSLLVWSARFTGAAGFESPTRSAVESLLADSLGLPAQVGAVGFDVFSLAMLVEEVEVQVGSWRLVAPRIWVRPDWTALMGGRLRPYAWTERFELIADASDGAEAVARLPELFDVIGIPDAHIRLRGGELHTRERAFLLGALAFELEEARGDAAIRIRARQESGGRLDARGFVSHEGTLVVDAYLDGLATPSTKPWVAHLGLGRRAGFGLPELTATASGRWHIAVGPGGRNRHEFALELRTSEKPAVATARRQPVTRLMLGGHLQLEGGAETRIVPGSRVRVTALAERLRVRGSEDQTPWLVSGPFEIDLHPFGPVEDPYLVLQAVFDGSHLELPRGFRKPAGQRGRLTLVHGGVPGDSVRTRFRLDVASLEVAGEVSPTGGLVASSEWLPLARLGEIWPLVSQRATGGRLRIKSLRADGMDDFDAAIEFASAEWTGPRMPFPVNSLDGTLRVTPASVDARDLLASFANLPVRFDVAARRGMEPDAPWRLSFRAEADAVELPDIGAAPEARGAPGSGIAMPAELVGIAQQHLPLLRDLGLTTRLEIERGLLRCARLRSRGETLRRIEVDMGLRSLHLDLTRVSFERRGVRRSYKGSIDLNPLLPDVRLAALP
jgi:hypothetical protein